VGSGNDVPCGDETRWHVREHKMEPSVFGRTRCRNKIARGDCPRPGGSASRIAHGIPDLSRGRAALAIDSKETRTRARAGLGQLDKDIRRCVESKIQLATCAKCRNMRTTQINKM